MKWHLQTVTASSTRAVSVADFKSHARISTSADDTYIETLLDSAQQFIERNFGGGRQLLSTVYDLVMDEFPASDAPIYLPRPPATLSSSTNVTITYYNTTAATTTVDEYLLLKPTHGQAYLVPEPIELWPSTVATRPDAVTVRYTAGYGTSETAVPAGVRHAVKMLASHWYEMREPVITGTIASDVPLSVTALLQSYGWGYYG